MQSQRLTRYSRAQILKAVMTHTFEKRERRLNRQEHALAERVRNHALGKHKKAVEALPKGFIAERDSIAVNAGGRALVLAFSGGRRLPANIATGSYEYTGERRVSLLIGSPLEAAVIEWSDREKALEDDRRDLLHKLTATLESFYTTKKLVEEWPDVAKFLPELKQATLPAIRADELNAQIAAARAGA